MTFHKTSLAGAVAALALTGCIMVDEAEVSAPEAVAVAPEAMTADEARTIVEARNAEFERLFAAGEAMELATQLYTTNGRIVPPDAPDQVGADAIAAYWTGGMTVIGSVDLKTVEAVPAGEGYIAERTHVTLYDPDGAALGGGKAVILWTQEDGTWKMEWDSWNNGPAE